MVKITEELVRKKSEHNERLISTLEELSLHQEDIEVIENIHNWCRNLKILLLQSNLISKLENLHKLKKLEYLNLAVNNIERIENLEKLESLRRLDLTLNFIGELTSIESLRDNYNLRELTLTGNPCSDYPKYRDYVIATLSQLEYLDSKEIKLSDKIKAQKNLEENRRVIVQKQAIYAIERDEQRIRFQQQKTELEAKLSTVEDEEERIKTFWDSKSEHCPEIRKEIADYHRLCKQRNDNLSGSGTLIPNTKIRRTILYAPCGRPYNLNQAKLPFVLKDETDKYILELNVYKFLDTSHIVVDIESIYIRVSVKEKIFQIALANEVKSSDAIVQRSQITGQLVVQAFKLKVDQLLLFKTKKDKSGKSDGPINQDNKDSSKEIKGTVNYKNIVSGEMRGREVPTKKGNGFENLPELI